MIRKGSCALALCLLLADSTASHTQQSSDWSAGEQLQSKQTQSRQALEFLGSYSAPSAIAATETGHVSAHPLSPPAGRRLRRIETGPTLLPPWASDLAWSGAELSAACGTGVNPETAEKAKRVSGDRATPINEDHAHESQCLPLAWNIALSKAYARLPGALEELARESAHAPSPTVGHVALLLARLTAGDITTARGDSEKMDVESTQTEKTGVSAGRSTVSREKSRGASAMVQYAGVPKRDKLWARAIWGWASGQIVEAREILTQLASLEPDTAAVWFALGGVALEEARVHSRRLAESSPDSSWNRRLESEALSFRYTGRAILPTKSETATVAGGESSDAKSQASAPAVSPHDSHPELELGRLELLPDSPEILYLRARAALRLSELAYDRAGRSPIFSAFLHAIRALAAEEENDEAAAEREYRAGLIENPESPLLHAGLGHLLRQRLQLEPARSELARATALDPTDSVAVFELGDVYLRMNEPARALPLLTRALEAEPELLVARWSRAKAYLALGDNRQALSDLEAAAPADRSGELQRQLALLYRKMGREDLAKQAQERSDQQGQAAKPNAARSHQ